MYGSQANLIKRKGNEKNRYPLFKISGKLFQHLGNFGSQFFSVEIIGYNRVVFVQDK